MKYINVICIDILYILNGLLFCIILYVIIYTKIDDKSINIDKLNLIKIFTNSINFSLFNCLINPNIIGKQLFIERDLINDIKIMKGYHIELLLPLFININKYINITMCLVIRINNKSKQYNGMSIITKQMAYVNSRLIGPVKHQWLKP